MEITLGLQYREQQPYTVAGAFIPGHSAAIWLTEISSWGIPMSSLKALLIPENKQSLTVAGLFIILTPGHPTPIHYFRHPYQLLGGKLFIPVTAALTPAVTPIELSGLLIWDWQVFHPSLGFTGFENKEVIDVSDLLSFTAPLAADWEYARMGIAPRTKLQRIGILHPETDIFSDISRQIGHQPLSALSDTTTSWLPTNSFLQKIWSLLFGFLGSKAGQFTFGATNDIEKKRNKELEKLLRMFEEDEATALQYALPLDSPYAYRGTTHQGTSLQRNDTNFSLTGLGGGTPGDVWDAGKYRQDLRRKYELAAKAAITAGDFKKAAYIYAHLLGDYTAATNVLEQGGYYRDAAVMYKTHLNNPGAAARCLEKGGLLLESIEIYRSLQQFEKAADLYMILDQRIEAVDLYNKAAQTALRNSDILAAAGIIHRKLEDVVQAKQVLLHGWNQHVQTTSCLQKYLELSGDQLEPELHFIYKNHLTPALEENFLQVLSTTGMRYQREEASTLATDMAYEIISKQPLPYG